MGFRCWLDGNISSSRMLCLSEACFLLLVLTNTLASIDVLSAFLFWMAFILPPSFSSTQSLIFLPSSLHPSSQLSSLTLSNETQSSGLTRLLGVAFPGEKEKQCWENEQEEARRRDHRRIGTVSGRCELDAVCKKFKGFVVFAFFGHSHQFAASHWPEMTLTGQCPFKAVVFCS